MNTIKDEVLHMKKLLCLLFAVMCLFSVAAADDPFIGMLTYNEGQYKVGYDMQPGTYVLLSTSKFGGYFCVSSDANGRDILFNDNFDTNSIVEVRRGEYVELSRCMAIDMDDFYSEYTINYSGNTGVMLRVGYDIMPGEYKLRAESGTSGYYCIYPDPRHDDILANDNFKNSAYVYLSYGQYVILNRCYVQ